MTLIPRIGGAIIRSTTGTVRARKIRRQLHAIMSFVLLLPTELNKVLRLDITNEALPDQVTVTDLDFDTNTLSCGASTYGREEVKLILGYIDEDVTICTIWPKIQKKVAEIEAA